MVRYHAHGAGFTALHHAARRGDVEIVEILEAGADPYIENEMGLNHRTLYKSAPFPMSRGHFERQNADVLQP